MAEKKTRIHHLAKELEVKSKTIIEKCEAEGISIKNHMHVVSAGLEATIREWFSEGAHATTLEESERVDLKSVRVKRPKKAPPPPEPLPPAETPPPAAPVPVEVPAAEVAATAVLEPPPPVEEPEVAAPAEPAPEPPVEAEPPSVAAEVEVPDAPEPPVVADKPATPKPVGPQNVPAAAKLQGPKLVRMDRPEVMDRPRPAARTPRPPRGPAAPSATPEEEFRDDKRGGAAGRGRRPGTETEPARRSHPRRGPRDNRQASSEQLKEWREREMEEMRERMAQASGRGISGMRAVEKRGGGRRSAQPIRARKDKIELTEPIRIKDFSREAGIPVLTIVNNLQREHDIDAGINSSITAEQAQLIAADFEIELVVHKAKTALDRLAEEFAEIERKKLLPRPPVVTVLGHVDHGKTSLLDRIRKANVTAGEAGGITQHVGAYRVKVDDSWVAFLDTPGHQAFSEMRARGANITDVVVLVVAADDGVMPTTIEALNHARAAGVTIVVALNKIDLDHDLNKLYGQLTEHGLTPSGEWGGDTDVIKTSASTGEGIDDLLSHLATLSDVLELKADSTIPATGTVIEAGLNDRIGSVAKILVQEGTLKPGQIIVCGTGHGRVRSMKDEHGKAVQKAGPSTPVEVTGLSEAPMAGDKFYVVKNAKLAKEIAEEQSRLRREEELTKVQKPQSLTSMIATAEEGEIPEVNVIIRADVQGSIDALRQQFAGFPDTEVKLKILHSGVGTVTQSDLVLAESSNAIVIAFNVVADPQIQKQANTTGVEIRSYKVIYNVSDDIKKALEDKLAPEVKLESRGRAEVREIFGISKVGKVAGCIVQDGMFNRGHQVRVIRDGVIVKDGASLDSLRRFKDDVKEVKSGFECGIKIADFDDVKPGDIIEAFERLEIARTLESTASQ